MFSQFGYKPDLRGNQVKQNLLQNDHNLGNCNRKFKWNIRHSCENRENEYPTSRPVI
jgi:hypothetical protein